MNYLDLFTSWWSLDFLRDALFLCITFFLAALSRTFDASRSNLSVSSDDALAVTLFLSLVIEDLIAVLIVKDEIKEGADKLFETIKLGKIKIEISKKYRSDETVQAHKDLESRKIIGPAIIIP